MANDLVEWVEMLIGRAIKQHPSKGGDYVLTWQQGEAAVRMALSEAIGSKTEGWQSIETAPTDGSSFLAAVPHEDGSWRITRMHWVKNQTNDKGLFHETFAKLALGIGHVRKHQPTHWRPLPEPPSTLSGESE